MNFFGDDFMLDNSPTKTRGDFKKTSNISRPGATSHHAPSYSNLPSRSNANKDDFDDLLDHMLLDQDRKKSKSRGKETLKQFSFSPAKQKPNQFSKTGVHFGENTMANLNANKNISRQNQNSARSVIDDMLDDDARSFKSGVTNKGSVAFDRNYDKGSVSGFELQGNRSATNKFMDASIQPALPPSSSVRAMKPPMRKRQSRQPSVANQDSTFPMRFYDQIQSVQDLQSHLPPMPPKKHTQEARSHIDHGNFGGGNFELSTSMAKQPLQRQKEKPKIEQKIVYVKQENQQVKQQHQKQLKMIKQSHERQLKFLQESLNNQIKAHKQTRIDFLKQNQANLQNETRKWKKIEQDNLERVKSMLEWENKKKQQTSQMEIDRLKSFLETTTRITSEHEKTQRKGLSENQLRQKEQQLERQRKRIVQLQNSLKMREKNMELREIDHETQRKRDQDHVQRQLKKIYSLESELKKQQIDSKRTIGYEKQNMASQLASAQLEVSKKRQSMKLEKQQLNLERQFFEKQKLEIEEFNKKVMQSYKAKLKQLQNQKERVHSLETQLYQKIHTVQLMATQNGINLKATDMLTKTFLNKDHSLIKQNLKDQSNKLEEKLKTTKERFAKMEEWTRKNGQNKSMTDRNKIEMDTYLTRVGKNQRKYRPHEFE